MDMSDEFRRECDRLFVRFEARFTRCGPQVGGISKRLESIDQHLSATIAALTMAQAGRRSRRENDDA